MEISNGGMLEFLLEPKSAVRDFVDADAPTRGERTYFRMDGETLLAANGDKCVDLTQHSAGPITNRKRTVLLRSDQSIRVLTSVYHIANFGRQ